MAPYWLRPTPWPKPPPFTFQITFASAPGAGPASSRASAAAQTATTARTEARGHAYGLPPGGITRITSTRCTSCAYGVVLGVRRRSSTVRDGHADGPEAREGARWRLRRSRL